ncbi:hypothetical protein POX_d05535 [Penicillium oxalicum]|uniref:Rhodopsin domain-containing protein n=1 Tax=Penicillium oxalicum (strain 114-2 / CGMCC 5302) TaxID=933388 RepID=S8BBQ3_PENO1|nr:hypothetical protein POX_d05535 [Penicillium oxalicum]EPS32302.1 hypothetical protein PDE_07262 [Penicillium oxalicum 114-2]KAI2790032.1 hypothetical protein POX_d05535 [Penicillium oxalicum]
MSIPKDILAAEAAGRIPDGIPLEYLAQSRDYPAIVGILIVVCLSAIILLLRLYARGFLVKRLGLDDWLAVATMVLYIPFVVLSLILIKLGSGRHIEYIQYVLSMSTVRQTEILDFVAHIFYTTALFLCRLSGLAFYYRISVKQSKLRLVIIVVGVIIFAAYLPQLFLLIFHCLPVTGLWPYGWQIEPVAYKCLSWGLVYSVNSGVSLACDVMMFIIPGILIQMLHTSLRKKIQLSAVMFPGILVIIISAIRVWLVVEGQWAADGSWAYNPMLCVENAEIAATLIALSVPALKPLFGNIFGHLRLTEYTPSNSRSRFTSRRTQPRPPSGEGSTNCDDKNLLNWSQRGHDNHEMMPTEVFVSRDRQNRGSSINAAGIRVTNEVDVTRTQTDRSRSRASTRTSTSSRVQTPHLL